MWTSRDLALEPRRRGIHLITREVVGALPELEEVDVGLLHVFIHHTSASLTLTENASPEVRTDLEGWLNAAVPEETSSVETRAGSLRPRDRPLWKHSLEGPDDMPAHVKASLFGSSLTLPVRGGRLLLGTWQGICLAEHRDRGGSRRLTLTLQGS